MRMPGLVVADEPLNIHCGVRLLRTGRDAVAIASQLGTLVDRLYADVPSGVAATAWSRADSPGVVDSSGCREE